MNEYQEYMASDEAREIFECPNCGSTAWIAGWDYDHAKSQRSTHGSVRCANCGTMGHAKIT